MLIKEMVPCCDFTDRKYDTPVEGGWFLAQEGTWADF